MAPMRTSFLLLAPLSLLAFASAALPALADTSLLAVSTAKSSSNWSGYAARAGNYTSVGGTWIIPVPGKVSHLPLSGDVTWVGIGGLSGATDLIQAGTQAIVVNGVPVYQAWYETLPDNQVITPLVVRGGDHVSASLREKSPSVWHLVLTNQTTHKSYETDITYQSGRATAEWIEERPLSISDSTKGYLPLDRFSSVDFTSAYAAVNDVQMTLAGAGAGPLIMVNAARDPLAIPTVIGKDDSSFTVRQFEGTDQMIESIPTIDVNADPTKEVQTPIDLQFAIPALKQTHFPISQEFSPGGFDVEMFINL